MTELRQKFERHLIFRRYSPRTNAAYINAVKMLAKYHRQSPDRLANGQVQDYLHYILEERKLSWNTCNVHFSAIKCFYTNVLKRKIELSIPPVVSQKRIREKMHDNLISNYCLSQL